MYSIIGGTLLELKKGVAAGSRVRSVHGNLGKDVMDRPNSI